MKLHTVFITYNRLELTKQAVQSYLDTTDVPYTYVIVDNASADDTWYWLRDNDHDCILLTENRYPGYACNRGWERAPGDATHLHRADNDFAFLPGWCEEVARCFEDHSVGQVGLRTGKEELYVASNVGGNCVIRRELWDRGLRYDETPWPRLPPGLSEDSFLSPEIERMGYSWTRVNTPCILTLASGDWNDPYYQASYGARNIEKPK